MHSLLAWVPLNAVSIKYLLVKIVFTFEDITNQR